MATTPNTPPGAWIIMATTQNADTFSTPPNIQANAAPESISGAEPDVELGWLVELGYT